MGRLLCVQTWSLCFCLCVAACNIVLYWIVIYQVYKRRKMQKIIVHDSSPYRTLSGKYNFPLRLNMKCPTMDGRNIPIDIMSGIRSDGLTMQKKKHWLFWQNKLRKSWNREILSTNCQFYSTNHITVGRYHAPSFLHAHPDRKVGD